MEPDVSSSRSISTTSIQPTLREVVEHAGADHAAADDDCTRLRPHSTCSRNARVRSFCGAPNSAAAGVDPRTRPEFHPSEDPASPSFRSNIWILLFKGAASSAGSFYCERGSQGQVGVDSGLPAILVARPAGPTHDQGASRSSGNQHSKCRPCEATAATTPMTPFSILTRVNSLNMRSLLSRPRPRRSYPQVCGLATLGLSMTQQ